jgi:glycosyltransferase involved in cell wall biosynthesis
LDASRKYILFFGFIRKYKGLDLLLEAFEQAAPQLDGWDLLIAGEFYEDAQPYLDIVSRGKLESRIHLHTKFIPNSEVADYFSVSDMVAQPYRNATQSGVSQVAYHFEVPMIITDVGGLAELVPHGEAGWVCEPRVESLADALVSMALGDAIARMREKLPVLKQQFSWSSMVEALSIQAE